jgi:hypothetical protein
VSKKEWRKPEVKSIRAGSAENAAPQNIKDTQSTKS